MHTLPMLPTHAQGRVLAVALTLLSYGCGADARVEGPADADAAVTDGAAGVDAPAADADADGGVDAAADVAGDVGAEVQDDVAADVTDAGAVDDAAEVQDDVADDVADEVADEVADDATAEVQDDGVDDGVDDDGDDGDAEIQDDTADDTADDGAGDGAVEVEDDAADAGTGDGAVEVQDDAVDDAVDADAAACVPADPAIEACNGVDDDCDGQTDELACDDGNGCTADLCAPGVGGDGCDHTNIVAGCSDGDPCTVGEACSGGACSGGSAATCNDGVGCTLDSCASGKGCVHTPDDGLCDDGKICTDDACASGGCAHTANSASCDDGDPCTSGEACKDGACAGGGATACDDGNPCTSEACEVGVGCVAKAVAGACDDGNPCTSGDACDGGVCKGEGAPDCDDGKACTDDGCLPSAGCTHTDNTIPCDDGDPCSLGDACKDGACKAGAAVGCDDGDACTEDSCVVGKGCAHAKLGASTACDDGDACTVGDACEDGACKAGGAADCDDGDACTSDGCAEASGCTHAKLTAGPCDDGDACTLDDTCQGGVCAGKSAKACDDGDVCTADACDKAKGCVHVPANGAVPCDDGDACTVGDACQGGGCAAGKAIDCDDGNACTTKSCDKAKGCVAVAKAEAATPACDGTTLGGRCYRAFKATLAVAPAAAACKTWGGTLSSIASGAENSAVRGVANASCGAVSAWIGLSDVAQEGVWVWADGTPYSYNNWQQGEPNNFAGNEHAVQMYASGTWNDINGASTATCYVCERALPLACDDKDACTNADRCFADGSCKGSGGCDDGNPCTADACLGASKCSHQATNEGASCGGTGVCKAGACVIGTAAQPALSCAAIVAVDKSAKSGVFWLDVDGAGGKAPQQAYCDMERGGGGWTLVAVVSEDKQDTWTWNSRLLWTTNTATFGALSALHKDYKSSLHHELVMRDVAFVHAPSGVWAAYHDVSDGKTSFADRMAQFPGPACQTAGKDGFARSAGTLGAGGKLCDDRLYIHPQDHDGNANSCEGDKNPEHAFGPAWSANNGGGCPFDDPGILGGLGPLSNDAGHERGEVGFGGVLGLNKGKKDSGENRMAIFVR